MIPSGQIAGIVLAGGLARRMGGGDKGLRLLAGRPVLDHVIARARPQVGSLALNANGDPARFDAWELPVVADTVAENPGPLAGILAGLEWAQADAPDVTHLASFACDAPLLPRDLVSRLAAALGEGAEIACAKSGGRSHPVFALWPVSLAGALREKLVGEGVRKVDAFTAAYSLAEVDFPTTPHDPFFNANRPEDLAEAERMMRGRALLDDDVVD